MKSAKQVSALLLALVLCLGMLPGVALAADSDFTIKDGVLTAYNGPGGDVVIPEGVTAIGGIPTYYLSIFSNRDDITSITIPTSVTTIGNGVFSSCTGLESVTIPTSITTIGASAFSGCTGLKSITIPSSITSFGGGAFSGCTGLTDIVFSDGLLTIGVGAFSNCTGLTEITIPDSVTTIGESAFGGCTNLTDVTLSPTTKYTQVNSTHYTFPFGTNIHYAGHTFTIEDGVLTKYAGEGGKVIIPDNVTSIGWQAFANCTNMTSVTIPSSVTSIGSYAFESCTGLTGVTIPSSVTSIGDRAFQNCTGLTGATIPNSVTSIGYGAFSGCTGLTSVTIPGSVTVIEGTFYGCSGLTKVTIPNGVTSIGDYAFYHCTKLTGITIPAGVTSIGHQAFRGCTNLTSITIPDSVTSIGWLPFDGCTSLTDAYVPSSIDIAGAFPSTTTIHYVGDTFEINDGVLTKYRGEGGNVVIPENVTAIGSGAFSDCVNVTSVTIPNGVTSIGSSAFSGCTGLTSITIPDSVTSISNTNSTFSGCNNLTDITLPGDNTWGFLKNCANLTKVTITGKKVADRFFSGNGGDKVTNITISNGVTSIGANAFSGLKNLTSVTISNSVTSIGSNAFSNCSALRSIAIPGSVTSIGSNAFSGCTGLKDLTISNGVQTIAQYAFSGCTGLTSVTFPDSMTSIAYYAFYGCTNLTDVYITYDTKFNTGSSSFPSTTTVHYRYNTSLAHTFDIENGVLKGYTGPGGDVVIPEGVTSIAANGSTIFNGHVTSITFPSTMTELSGPVLMGCSYLTDVTIPASITKIGAEVFVTYEDESGMHLKSTLTIHGAAGSYAETFVKEINEGRYERQWQGYRYLSGGPKYTFVADQAWPAGMKKTDFIIENGVLVGYTGPGGDVTVPSGIGIKEIANTAFHVAHTLKSLTVSPGVTKINIENDSVEKMVLPDGITGSVTLNCANLEKLTIGDNLSSIDLTHTSTYGSTRSVAPKLKELTIGKNAGTVSVNAPNLETFAISEGVTALTLDCPKLEKLVLPDSITSLKLNCPKVKELNVPRSLTDTSAYTSIFDSGRERIIFSAESSLYRGYSFQNIRSMVKRSPKLEEMVNNPSRTLENHMAPNLAIRDTWSDLAIRPQTAKVTNLSNQICAGLTSGYEKAKAISEWVVGNIEYDYDYYYAGLKDYSDVPFNPDEVLDAGMAVCAGYARLTQALLNAQGIPCLYLTGWTSGGNHAWNLALVDGEYIWMDNTWGMDYFDVGTAFMSLDHIASGATVFDNVKGPESMLNPTLDREILDELNKETDGAFEDVEIEEKKTETDTNTAISFPQTVLVDGKEITFYTYALVDEKGGITNYVKLRDVAAALNGTKAQFEVGWDGSINLETGKRYTAVGGELIQTFDGDKPYVVGDTPVNVNGSPADLAAITLWDDNGGNYNYFKLRDLGKALGFNVGWSADKGIFIQSDRAYTDAD